MNKKILILEDEAALRDILHDKLSSAGFEIIEAKDGEEGLRLAKSESPDLILVDIITPKIDGLTMLKRLRETDKGKEIKFIILTNVDSNAEIAKAMKIAGVTVNESFEYFVKSDIKLEDVVKKVHEKLKIN